MPASRRWILVGGVAVAAIIVLGLFVDRDAATFAHVAFGEGSPWAAVRRVCVALTHLVDPIVPLAVLALFVLGPAVAAGSRLDERLRCVFATAVATLVTVAVKDQLKFAFGRLWPETWVNGNPSWIGEGAFGFVPFHGGTGWSSFPSGHMAVITAPLTILAIARPAWRRRATIPIVLVAIGLYGADYHFLSDIVAGTLVGLVCAVLVWCFFMRPNSVVRSDVAAAAVR